MKSLKVRSRLALVGVWCWRIFISFIIYLLLVDWNFLFLFGQSPNIRTVDNPDLAVASEIFSRDSVLLGRYYLQDRSPVTFEQIPSSAVNALLAAEDIRFYKHFGIELRTPFTIVYSSIMGDGRGGSTITQQLAKNLFKTRSDAFGLFGRIPGIRVIVFKTKEWITALKLEFKYSKNEILTLYLNTVNFGSNAYGIKTAARTFFSVPPESLSVEQSVLLVGLLKAPSYYSPVLNPDRSIARRNIVISQMVKYEFLKP
ncbi:MAG: transglycosylase domain-containing protein, partial [Fibrobacteres bacterium]|nr:transglycosylase domain-containing protein [Fibrobacterota bacterium]